MEQELRALLMSSAAPPGVTGEWVHWVQGPPLMRPPYVVLNLISDTEGTTMQGRDFLRQSRVQVDCYHMDFGLVANMARAIKDTLHGYRGGGFQGIFFVGGRTLREGNSEASAIYRASLDFMTHWRPDNG